jgi:hypothetical protein
MIPTFIAHQADSSAYAYMSGSFSVRRGLLLPVQDLREAAHGGKLETLVVALNRGSYAPIANDASAGDVLARVEGVWRETLAEASRDLPEPFLPYVLSVLDEREYAKAGLAERLLDGQTRSSSGTLGGEYAAYCQRIQASAGHAKEVLGESVFGSSLREALDAAAAGASASDAQTVFDFSFASTLAAVAKQYGQPAVIAYMAGLLKLMLAGQALKVKLRSGAHAGASIQRLVPFLKPEVQVSLTAVLKRIQPVSWDMLQPADLIPEASAFALPVARHFTADERLVMLEDALDAWLVGSIESAGYEPYGVTVVFGYLIDFRREVWGLRRLLKEATAAVLRSDDDARGVS